MTFFLEALNNNIVLTEMKGYYYLTSLKLSDLGVRVASAPQIHYIIVNMCHVELLNIPFNTKVLMLKMNSSVTSRSLMDLNLSLTFSQNQYLKVELLLLTKSYSRLVLKLSFYYHKYKDFPVSPNTGGSFFY